MLIIIRGKRVFIIINYASLATGTGTLQHAEGLRAYHNSSHKHCTHLAWVTRLCHHPE
jgi:hypothetical protein